ncbi:MAG: hypothetical protein QOG57_2356, partial [Pseudonocardiales bacterium]|nr:hypothetical protein [Pseudonocardiales bacterium]
MSESEARAEVLSRGREAGRSHRAGAVG